MQSASTTLRAARSLAEACLAPPVLRSMAEKDGGFRKTMIRLERRMHAENNFVVSLANSMCVHVRHLRLIGELSWKTMQ
jgi:hypothetical protein